MKKTKLIALSLVLALIFSMIMPLMTVIAVTNSEEGGEPDTQGSNIIVKFGTDAISGNVATYTIDGTDVTLTVNGADISGKEVSIARENLETLSFTIGNTYNDATMQVIIRGENNYNQVLNVDSNKSANLNGLNLPNGVLNLNIENKNPGGNNPPPPPQQQTNKTATINIDFNTSGTYKHEGQNKHFEENGDISINGFMLRPGDKTLNYNLEDGKNTVTFNFSSLWHMKYYDSIVINGTTYNVSSYLNYDDQKSWLDHYNGQIAGFDIPNVPVADTYNISIKVGRQQVDHIANFLWTGDPNQEYEKAPNGDYILDENGEKIKGPNYIGNAHLEMIGLEYTVGGKTYKYNENDFKSGDFNKDYVEYDNKGTLKYDEGSLVIPAGSKVTMRITPKYGYQVLASNFAKSGLTTTDDGVSEFTFTIGGGAAYFTADVVKYDDVVKADSKKVQSGDIKIADGTVNAGTVRLSVNDVELDEEKTKEFEGAAGDYKIKSYLDIDLDQILFRGTVDSVWESRIHNLDEDATITLKLEDGVDGNDIVIVHNINDGDKFETIQIDSYDPATNTITFKTKSFSNYAIASKTTENTSNNDSTQNSGTTLNADSSKSDVKATIKTEKELPDNCSLVVKEISIPKEVLKEEKNLKKVFDISVLDSNGAVVKVSDNKMQITISLEEELLGFNTYKVVYINDGKIVETLPATVVDGKLTFETTHLSEYGIVAYNAENNGNTVDNEVGNPQTGDNIITIVTIFAISTLGAFCTAKLNKNHKVRKH